MDGFLVYSCTALLGLNERLWTIRILAGCVCQCIKNAYKNWGLFVAQLTAKVPYATFPLNICVLCLEYAILYICKLYINGIWIVNGLHLQSPFVQSTLHRLTFSHSCTDSGVKHARQQPARRVQLGLGVFLREPSTLRRTARGSRGSNPQPSDCQTLTALLPELLLYN